LTFFLDSPIPVPDFIRFYRKAGLPLPKPPKDRPSGEKNGILLFPSGVLE
jgi:hypothetical protein